MSSCNVPVHIYFWEIIVDSDEPIILGVISDAALSWIGVLGSNSEQINNFTESGMRTNTN